MHCNMRQAALLIIVALPIVFGQTFTSSVNGTLLDPTGAPINGAGCTLTQEETAAGLAISSGANGLLSSSSVPFGSLDISGSTQGARINVIGDAQLSRGERTFYRNFNTAAFAVPAVGTFGNAGVGILRGPGINKWDMAASRRFLLFSESRWDSVPRRVLQSGGQSGGPQLRRVQRGQDSTGDAAFA